MTVTQFSTLLTKTYRKTIKTIKNYKKTIKNYKTLVTLNKNYKINDFGNFPRSQIKGFATTACFCVTVIQNYKKL